MKFSFEISRSKMAASKDTGRAINSPKVLPQYAAALREYHSFVRAHNESQTRMYDSAVTTNLNPDFVPTVGSANAEVLTSLYISRGRARTLVKDFPTAKGIQRTFKNNTVGDDPFRLEMKVGHWDAEGNTFTLEKKINRLIQDAWDDARLPKNLTVRGDMGYMELCQMVEASALRDGSILARKWDDFPYNKYGFALEMIESDRLQESYMGKTPDTGNVIRFSIERDKWNRPIAYWILNRHPGDVFAYNGPEKSNVLRERVPAEKIIHFNNLRDRAEQDIGFPEYDSVIQTLHRNRQFDIAHVTAAIWSCCKPFWIKQEFPTGMPYVGDPGIPPENFLTGAPVQPANGLGGGDGKGGGADKIKISEPGTGEILNYGQTPVQLDPKFPIDAASQFRHDNHLDIASGVGLSYGSVSSDYQKYSFSVARFATLPERDNFKVRQEKMRCDFVREHFNAWLKNAILSCALDLPFTRYEEFCTAAHFHAKRWPYIQPVQDVQADGIALELNLTSRQEILAESENGRSIDEVDSDNAAGRKSLTDHGLPLPEDATIPTIKKGEPGTEDNSNGQPAGEPPQKKRFFQRIPASNGEHHEFE